MNRLIKLNAGVVTSTRWYKPWKIKNTISFIEKEKALAFEKYLKSHSAGHSLIDISKLYYA